MFKSKFHNRGLIVSQGRRITAALLLACMVMGDMPASTVYAQEVKDYDYYPEGNSEEVVAAGIADNPDPSDHTEEPENQTPAGNPEPSESTEESENQNPAGNPDPTDDPDSADTIDNPEASHDKEVSEETEPGEGVEKESENESESEEESEDESKSEEGVGASVELSDSLSEIEKDTIVIDHFEKLNEWDAHMYADEFMTAETMELQFPDKLVAYVAMNPEEATTQASEFEEREESYEMPEEEDPEIKDEKEVTPDSNPVKIEIPVTWESENPYAGGLLGDGEIIEYHPVWDYEKYQLAVEVKEEDCEVVLENIDIPTIAAPVVDEEVISDMVESDIIPTIQISNLEFDSGFIPDEEIEALGDYHEVDSDDVPGALGEGGYASEEQGYLGESATDSSYIPELSSLPVIRNQNPYGTCWTFATNACVEIGMISQGKADTSIDLSELQLAEIILTHDNLDQTDPLGGTEGDSSEYYGTYRNNYLTIGGNVYFSSQGLANWMGVATESTLPYDIASDLYTVQLDSSQVYNDYVHLTDYYKTGLLTSPDEAKKLIKEYGAISTAIYMNTSFYKYSNNAYYTTSKYTTNHQVTIVGWDDNFPASNFNVAPAGDGAWLIRNSYGFNGWGVNGYFWLSYYDKSVQDLSYAFVADYADNYDHNYQYDGVNSSGGSRMSCAANTRISNIFTVSGNAEGAERIDAVSLFLPANKNVNYAIDIYLNPEENKPESGTRIAEAHTTGTTSYAGYTTVELASPVIVEEGDTYSVVVTFLDGVNVYVEANEGGQATSWYKTTASAKAGQSFLKRPTSTTWTDVGKSYKSNLRVKAFTNDLYKINYHLNDGINPENAPTYYDPDEDLVLTEPTKYGYTFGGWYLDAEMTSLVENNTLLKGAYSAGIDVYAKWFMTVTYSLDAEDATWADSQSVPSGWTLDGNRIYEVRVGEAANTPLGFLPEDPVRPGFVFLGWYTEPDGAGVEITTATYTISDGLVIYACWDEDTDVFHVNAISDQIYTGSAIKPAVQVYCGRRLLTQGKDYTVSYRNNTSVASADDSRSPRVIVRGRGKYTNSVTVPFSIVPRTIKAEQITVGEMVYSYTGKAIKPAPVVTITYTDAESKTVTKKLTSGRDFTVSYPDTDGAKKAYIDAGDWTVRITGAGGYAFEALDVPVTITNSKTMSQTSVKVTNWNYDVSYPGGFAYGLSHYRLNGGNEELVVDGLYTGGSTYRSAVLAHPMTVTVSGGLSNQKAYLWTSPGEPAGADAEHYYYRVIRYSNNTQAGYGSITIQGVGLLQGTRTISYRINGTSISRTNITYEKEYVYSGAEIKPVVIVKYGNLTLTEGVHYSVSYSDNVNAGRGKIKIYGIGGFTGSVTRYFNINPYNIAVNEGGLFTNNSNKSERISAYNEDGIPEVPYSAKGSLLTNDDLDLVYDASAVSGADPESLVENVDYKLSFTNHIPSEIIMRAAGKQEATAVIRGCGNFTGTITQKYLILPGSLTACSITASDVVYKNKAGAYRVAPVVKDTFGRTLRAGRDYEIVSYSFANAQGVIQTENATQKSTRIVPAGTTVTVRIQATEDSLYSGTLTTTYRVVKKMISSVTVSIPAQIFNKNGVVLYDISEKNTLPVAQRNKCITVKYGKQALSIYRPQTIGGVPVAKPTTGSYYEIVSYTKNYQLGYATVTLAGVGDFGGTKTVRFRIKKK